MENDTTHKGIPQHNTASHTVQQAIDLAILIAAATENPNTMTEEKVLALHRISLWLADKLATIAA